MQRTITLISMLLFSILWIMSCSKTPEERFAIAVEKFNEKQDPEARMLIEEAFLKEWGAVELDDNREYVSAQNAIILIEEDQSTVITSDGFREPWSKEIRFAHYTVETSTLCISDGFSAEFYTFSIDEEDESVHINRERELFLTSDDKTSIDSLNIDNNKLFYFYKRQLHSIDLLTDEKKVVSLSKGSEVTLNPPYDKFAFKVFTYIDGPYIGCCLGDAGKYNLYVFDHTSQEQLFRQSVPSRFFYIKDSNLYFITGKTGNWDITENSLVNEESKVIKSFTSLKDISISRNKIFFIDEEGYHIMDSNFSFEFTENPMAQIERILNDYLIVSYRNTRYLVSTQLYFSITEKYESLTPKLFTSGGDLRADDLEK